MWPRRARRCTTVTARPRASAAARWVIHSDDGVTSIGAGTGCSYCRYGPPPVSRQAEPENEGSNGKRPNGGRFEAFDLILLIISGYDPMSSPVPEPEAGFQAIGVLCVPGSQRVHH